MSFEVPNLTLLRHFVAVAEDRGISKAAKRLRISQPALSKNIRRLEEMLGTQLFDRHSAGSRLTQSGATFLNSAQLIGLEYEHALQEIRNLVHEQESTITIGAGPVWTSTVIPEAVQRFHKRFPRHRLMVQTGSVDRMIEDLRMGSIDIFAGALIQQNLMSGFVRKRLATADFGIMCSRDHPLAQIEGIVDPQRISEHPFVSFVATSDVVKMLGQFLKERGAPPPRYLLETTSIYACVELARTGKYLFYETVMIADSPVGQGLVALNLGQPMHQFEMGFVFREGLNQMPAYRGIMKAMLEVFVERTPPERLLHSSL